MDFNDFHSYKTLIFNCKYFINILKITLVNVTKDILVKNYLPQGILYNYRINLILISACILSVTRISLLDFDLSGK